MSVRGDLSIFNLTNALDWYQNLASSKSYDGERSLTKKRIQGLLAINENHSEPIIDDLIGTVLSELDSATRHDLQYARSLLLHRIAKVEYEKQSLAHMLNQVDEKLGNSKNE